MNYRKFLIAIFSLTLMGFGLPKNIQKKVDKEIKTAFNVETFAFTEFSIPTGVAKELPSKFEENNFFKIEVESKTIGFAYFANAPSKTALFDYLVLLDKDLIVVKAKVLAYREEYGGEIGSKRWLKQFNGKTKGDNLKMGDNVVAISGATISVRSMTNAMNNLMQSLKILHQKDIL